MYVQTRHPRGEPLARFVHLQELRYHVAQAIGAVIRRSSATCAIVSCGTRAAIGWRSAWYVSKRLSGEIRLTTWASFQPRFTASCTPVFRPCPPYRGMHVRGVAGKQHAPLRYDAGHRGCNRECMAASDDGQTTPSALSHAGRPQAGLLRDQRRSVKGRSASDTTACNDGFLRQFRTPGAICAFTRATPSVCVTEDRGS